MITDLPVLYNAWKNKFMNEVIPPMSPIMTETIALEDIFDLYVYVHVVTAQASKYSLYSTSFEYSSMKRLRWRLAVFHASSSNEQQSLVHSL